MIGYICANSLQVWRLSRCHLSNDHRPAHVHVIGHGNEAVFELNCPAGPIELRENYGFSRSEMTQIATVLFENLGTLCNAWESIHGF
jgi:hypothetical protein